MTTDPGATDARHLPRTPQPATHDRPVPGTCLNVDHDPEYDDIECAIEHLKRAAAVDLDDYDLALDILDHVDDALDHLDRARPGPMPDARRDPDREPVPDNDDSPPDVIPTGVGPLDLYRDGHGNIVAHHAQPWDG